MTKEALFEDLVKRSAGEATAGGGGGGGVGTTNVGGGAQTSHDYDNNAAGTVSGGGATAMGEAGAGAGVDPVWHEVEGLEQFKMCKWRIYGPTIADASNSYQ